MIIGGKTFDTIHETYIMGILNVTPDSFSDGGLHNNIEKALVRAGQMIAEGADIIDVGGESARPGYTPVSEEEEIDRTAPVIQRIKAEFDIPVSLDTYKSKVAQAGIEAGADLINDIWGLKHDDRMGKIIAGSAAACCLMHNRVQPVYQNFEQDVLDDLKESVRIARWAGIREDRIILDPGVGFAKDYGQNLLITARLTAIQKLGYPVLLGTSRKSMIGQTLAIPVEERLAGTIATTVFGMLNGCSFIRVHDVLQNVQAVKMIRAIQRSG